MKLLLKRVEGCTLPLPEKKTSGACAVDFQVCLEVPHKRLIDFPKGSIVRPSDKKGFIEESSMQFILHPGDTVIVSLGFYADLAHRKLRLLPRSSMLHTQLGIANTWGLIDSDYRGEISAALVNHGKNPIRIKHGDRIIQGEFDRATYFEEVLEVSEMSETDRGTGGYGSTDEN